MADDNRIQIPIFYNELSDDLLTDFLDQTSAKLETTRLALMQAMSKMDARGDAVGHIVVYEYDIARAMGRVEDE